MIKRSYLPERGDIVWAVLDPRVGHEQSGRRPVLVLSPRLLAESTGLAVICPITSKVKGLPVEIPLHRTKTAGAVLPLHVRSVDINARKLQLIERCPKNITNKAVASVKALIDDYQPTTQ